MYTVARFEQGWYPEAGVGRSLVIDAAGYPAFSTPSPSCDSHHQSFNPALGTVKSRPKYFAAVRSGAIINVFVCFSASFQKPLN